MKIHAQSTLVSLTSKLAVSAGMVAALASTAHAGATKVFGSQWAWDNNFGGSNIGVTFGSGSTPSLTVTYNFGSYGLYGYPACIHGWHYGYNPAGDHLFPKKVSSISSSNCSFSYSSSGSNMAGDFAYDIFLRNDSSASTPQLEVMVWGGNDSWPIGGQVTTDGSYDVWEGYNSAAGYETITFTPHGSEGNGSLPTGGSSNQNLKGFYNWLASHASQYFNNNMYVDVVECGLEITRGNGKATCSANISS